MDSGAGITLFEPGDLRINIDNHQDEDEEAAEDQKRREEMLKAQLATEFDYTTDDDDDANEDDRSHSSCSSHDDSQPERRGFHSNGLILHNLSDISEHPANSGYQSAEVSKGEGDESTGTGQSLFSPSRSVPYKFVQGSMNRDYTAVSEAGGRGDADDHYQPLFKPDISIQSNEQFQPIFSNNTPKHRSENTNEDSAEAYRQADMNSLRQLQVLYEVRLREIHKLSSQLEAERNEAANHKQEMFRKMALTEAEKERAVLSRTEANKLLVASKEEIANLQKEAKSLKDTVATLQKEKTKSDELAELSKVQIQELEQRIVLMERCDPSKGIVRQTDLMVTELKNKHQQEVRALQHQVDTCGKKLLKKEEECKTLDQKVQELQKSIEVLLVEKADTINQLARGLEESQMQCRQLMAANVSTDNVRLQTQLEVVLREKDDLSQTVKALQGECTMMKSDLAQYESVTRLTLPQSQSSSDETDSILQLGLSSKQSQERRRTQSSSQCNTCSKLKDELQRAMLNQKAKRAEIMRLQKVIKSKDEELQDTKRQERIYLAQSETLTEQLNKMMAEITSIQDNRKEKDRGDRAEEMLTLNAELAELRKEKAALEREKFEVQQKLEDLTKRFEIDKRRDLSDYNKEYLKFHDEIVAKVRVEAEEEAELKIKEYSIRLEQSLKEVSEVKEMYVAVCAAKEQVAQSLSQATTQLQQVTAEKDRLAAELQENSALRDQMARRLNQSASSKSSADISAVQTLAEDRDRLRGELDQCVEMRDQLARRVNMLKRENDELSAEIQRLKTELDNKSPHENENQMSEECAQLQNQLAAMSARHTQELSSARSELQAARDRVVQLEKCARLQFETEMKSLRQDRDMLKTKCDEKEVQIKKLIESRKRPPALISVATETEEGGYIGEGVAERHRQELARCREEYNKALSEMEQTHQAALESIREQQREQLLAVEERTKQLTVQYFAQEVKRLEAKYIEEASRRPDPAVVDKLVNTIQEKTKEIESLKQRLTAISEEHRLQMAALQSQMETDRDSASQLMVQWAQEVKNIQGELKLKEAIIDDQRTKIEKAQSSAKRYRNKLIKTNQEITSQYTSKCAEYQAKTQEIIALNEKEVYEKIKQLEQIYEEREKKLKKMISKKHQIT